MTVKILRPIYETFKKLSKKGGGATPDEIINWFKIWSTRTILRKRA